MAAAKNGPDDFVWHISQLKSMKKLVCSLVAGLIMSSLALDARRLNVSSLCSTIREYRYKEGFEAISIGRLGLSLAGFAVRAGADGDEDAQMAAALVKGLKKVIVVEFESARETDKAAFCRDVERHLKGSELLMEVNDSEEHLSIYGVVSADGSNLSDMVIYGEEGFMVVRSGCNPMEAVGSIVEGC